MEWPWRFKNWARDNIVRLLERIGCSNNTAPRVDMPGINHALNRSPEAEGNVRDRASNSAGGAPVFERAGLVRKSPAHNTAAPNATPNPTRGYATKRRIFMRLTYSVLSRMSGSNQVLGRSPQWRKGGMNRLE